MGETPTGETEEDEKAEYETITKSEDTDGNQKKYSKQKKDHYGKLLGGKWLEAWEGQKSRKKNRTRGKERAKKWKARWAGKRRK